MATQALTKTQPTDGNNVKRSVLRVIGLSIITSGLYFFYWFFVAKNQLKRELKNDQHVGWQTVGLLVPILNIFILYWLYRDINAARGTQKLDSFPAVWYVVIPMILVAIGLVIGFGAIVSLIGGVGAALDSNDGATAGLLGLGAVGGLFALLLLFAAAVSHYVFMGLAISKLNQYWDKRSGGKAVEAKFRGGEIAIIVVGVLLMIMNYSGQYQRDDNTTNELLNDIEEQSTTSDDASSKPTPRQIYDQVQNGMTTDQVKAIAQRDPDTQTESDIEGLGKTQYWSFNRGSGFVSITFTNGAVSNKSIYE